MSLSFLLLIIDLIFDKLKIENLITYIIFMPAGILAFIQLVVRIKFNDGLAWLGYAIPFAFVMQLVNITFAIVISYSYKRRKSILKWMIITLLILMILEFSGCAISQLIDHTT